MNRHRLLLAALLVLLVVGLPAVVFLSQQRQETRSRAAASTTLYFTPTTTATAPLQKNIGDPVSLDVMISPGNNKPSLIKLEIPYDATRLQPTSSPFVVNTDAFPTTQEGPFVRDGKILISVSVGNDPTRAITAVTKIGTVNFTAISTTEANTSMISFGASSQVLSVATTDNASENVISTTTPAYVSIASAPTPTPTSLPPTSTPTPTQIPTPTPTRVPSPTSTPGATSTPTPTPTSVPNSTKLSFTVFLHGIGNSGDNTNPTNYTLSNKNPLTATKNVIVEVFDGLNALKASASGNIVYDVASGNFKGTIDLGTQIAASGAYNIKLKETTHLRRLIPGIQNITIGQTINMGEITLTAGDVNNDNTINILDYNLLVGCYSDLAPAVSCTSANKLLTDINDNGEVNQFDYNLFLREITVQNGQ